MRVERGNRKVGAVAAEGDGGEAVFCRVGQAGWDGKGGEGGG